MLKENEEPAFPSQDCRKDWAGLSIRDYFAGQALPAAIATLHQAMIEHDKVETPQWVAHATADMSYRIADAMLEARKKS